MTEYDVAIIGGGIYGCAVSTFLAEKSELSVCLLEKEYHLAKHQSGRNSGTLHPGLILDFEPGSQQARFAIDGMRRMRRFCDVNEIPINHCGLLAVATSEGERKLLEGISGRATENGINVELLETEAEIRDREPSIRGVAALFTPDSATIDGQRVTYELANKAQAAGVDYYLGHEVRDITGERHLNLQTDKGDIEADYLVNTAGAWAVRIAQLVELAEEYTMIPLRGDYYELVSDRRSLVRTNVYPVRRPRLEGYVDVHFTPRPDGKVIVGPTGRLTSGFASYDGRSIDFRQLIRTLSSRRFWNFMASPSRLKTAWIEANKSFRKEVFLEASQRLMPGLEASDLAQSYSGIAGHLLDRNGTESSGYVFEEGPQSVHLLQTHPGVTSALSVGEYLAEGAMRSV